MIKRSNTDTNQEKKTSKIKFCYEKIDKSFS